MEAEDLSVPGQGREVGRTLCRVINERRQLGSI